MKIEDVKDTIECRKQIVSYIEYLEKAEEFFLHVMHHILIKASILALKDVLTKVQDLLTLEVDAKTKTIQQSIEYYDKAKDKAFKHCLILEIKHNYTQERDREEYGQSAMNIKNAK
jgi:hypothetical protein